jgi:hypothetical protein
MSDWEQIVGSDGSNGSFFFSFEGKVDGERVWLRHKCVNFDEAYHGHSTDFHLRELLAPFGTSLSTLTRRDKDIGASWTKVFFSFGDDCFWLNDEQLEKVNNWASNHLSRFRESLPKKQSSLTKGEILWKIFSE